MEINLMELEPRHAHDLRQFNLHLTLALDAYLKSGSPEGHFL